MNKRYDILLGLALLVMVGTGYFFNKNRYLHTTTGEEITAAVYQNLEAKEKWTVEWNFNYEAGLMAGIATLGIGLVLLGMVSKGRKKVSQVSQP